MAHETATAVAWTVSKPGGRGALEGGPGVYRVTGQVPEPRDAYVAWLVLALHDGTEQRHRVFVTRRGRIQELLEIPAPILSAHLGVDPARDRAPQAELRFMPIGRIEYRLRQLWRIGRVLRAQPRASRRAAGLTFAGIARDLDRAYGVASQLRANTGELAYPDWHARYHGVSERDVRVMARRSARWRRAPHFLIVLAGNGADDDGALAATRDSLARQAYRGFSVATVDQARLSIRSMHLTGLFAGAEPATAAAQRWLLILHAGTRLDAAALYWLAHTIRSRENLGLVYADEDVADDAGQPLLGRFKPDWSPELLRSANYIGAAFAWRAGLLEAMPAWLPAGATHADAMHAILLALSALQPECAHIAAPLWRMPAPGDERCTALSSLASAADPRRVVWPYLARRGVDAALARAGRHGCRVRYALPADPPLVSIVIPTRDGLAHLERCIASILEKTAYERYEIIVVDNQSALPETHAYLAGLARRPAIRVLPFDEAFNYSRINNAAVAQARGELVCLLNNDTEVISSDWLEEMAGLLLAQDDIGVVGAKLLYPDGTVQHGGDAVGPGGCADHLHIGIGGDEPGYGGRALLTQELSAVTAACLLTRRRLYQSLGGLEEVHLPVAFNDVDFCLRVREAGLRVLWTPHARLYHHESATRGKDASDAQRERARSEVAYMRRRWPQAMRRDPYYNDNLNYQRPDFRLGALPRIERPW